MSGTIGSESIWNTDQDQYNNILMGLKKKVMIDLDAWNLIECYWSLRALWRELDAKFEEERDNLIKDIELLEKLRIRFEQGEEIKAEFWTALESLYLEICRLMKKHKIYYREAADQRRAIFNT